MPTRAELIASLSPEDRVKMETILKVEAATYTTPELLEESIADTRRWIANYIRDQNVCDENREAINRTAEIAFKFCRLLLEEWPNLTPPAGEMGSFLTYFINTIGFAALASPQLVGVNRCVRQTTEILNIQIATMSVEEILHPKPDPSNVN